MIPTRLDALPLPVRRVLLIFLLIAVGVSVTLPSAPVKVAQGGGGARSTDPDLYRHIIARVVDGQNYYAAAAAEHRARHYPLRPFVTVRLPTLATLSAWLGGTGIVTALFLLAAATISAWVLKFRSVIGGWQALAASALVAVQCAIPLGPIMALFHESWAALLIALSLACWKPEKWRLSLFLGLAACLFREIAAPYLFLMLAAATLDRRWGEALGWAAGLMMFAAILWLHAAALSTVVLAEDAASPGWSAMGGWQQFISAMTAATPLALAPTWVGKILIPLALLGWAIWRHPLALRQFGLLAGYATMLMLFARPDNWYWALMLAPALLAGLAFLPALFASRAPGPAGDTRLQPAAPR